MTLQQRINFVSGCEWHVGGQHEHTSCPTASQSLSAGFDGKAHTSLNFVIEAAKAFTACDMRDDRICSDDGNARKSSRARGRGKHVESHDARKLSTSLRL